MREKDKLWQKVKKDFPCDPALQEVHYARLKMHEQTNGILLTLSDTLGTLYSISRRVE